MAAAALILAVLAVSTSAPLVHAAAPTPALTFAALRVLLAGLVLAAISGRRMSQLLRLSARDFALVFGAAALLGVHFGVWISSLYFTSTAASVALVATQPIFAVGLGYVLLGDRARPRELMGIGVAALGCAVLARGDIASSSRALRGDLLALAGAATAAGYLVLGRRVRTVLSLAPYLAAVNLIAGLALLAPALLSDDQLLHQPDSSIAAIAACALLGSVLGHSLLNWSVRRIPAHLVTLAILGEPIGASLITWIWFDEVPPQHAVTGGAIILVGIAVAFVRIGPRPSRDVADQPAGPHVPRKT